eukprot:516959_1
MMLFKISFNSRSAHKKAIRINIQLETTSSPTISTNMKLSTALLLVASISAVAGQELYGPEYYGPQRRHLTKSEKGGGSGSGSARKETTGSTKAEKSGSEERSGGGSGSGSRSAKARKRHLEGKASSGGSSSSSSKKSSSSKSKRRRSSSSSTSSDDYFRGFRGFRGWHGGDWGRRQDCDIVVKLADYDTRTTSCADLIEDRIATTYPGLRVIEDTFCDSNVRCLPVSRRSTCDRRYLDRTMWDLGDLYRKKRRRSRRGRRRRRRSRRNSSSSSTSSSKSGK